MGNGLVEQHELIVVGRLKDRCPPLEVSPSHRRGRPLARRSATRSSLDELLQGHIEVVQLDTHPQRTRPESFLVAFIARPMAPLQNHALAPGEEILGKNPQLLLETHSECLVPHICAQLGRPPVLVQPDGGDLGREPPGECRLARGRKPADQHEPRAGPREKIVGPFQSHAKRLRALSPGYRGSTRPASSRASVTAPSGCWGKNSTGSSSSSSRSAGPPAASPPCRSGRRWSDRGGPLPRPGPGRPPGAARPSAWPA